MAWNNRKYWNFYTLEDSKNREDEVEKSLKFGKKSHRTKKTTKKSHRTKKSVKKSHSKTVKSRRTKKSVKKSRRTSRSKTHRGGHHDVRRLVLA